MTEINPTGQPYSIEELRAIMDAQEAQAQAIKDAQDETAKTPKKYEEKTDAELEYILDNPNTSDAERIEINLELANRKIKEMTKP